MARKTQRSVLFLPFFYDHDFHSGIALFAGENGWHLNAEMARTGRIPHGWEGEGIIMALTHDKESEKIARKSRIPIVDISLHRPDIELPRVAKDNRQIGQIAARHFLDQGWHSYAFVSREDHHVVGLRLGGFRDELSRHGLTCHELIWPARDTRKDGSWNDMRRWLLSQIVKLPKPLAVLAYNDYDAAVVMDACLHAGLAIPDKVGVLGVDDLAVVCPCQPVPLSSVQSQAAIVGYRAGELLENLMNGKAAPVRPILISPGGIAERQSTNRLVIRDPRLARAIELILEKLSEPFALESIAKQAGLSRKLLYRLFDSELHQFPAEFIRARRLDMARKLLIETDEREYVIAQSCGFPVMSTFIRQFYRSHKMKPREWRQAKRGEKGSPQLSQNAEIKRSH